MMHISNTRTCIYTNAPNHLHKSDTSLLGFCYPREDSVKCSQDFWYNDVTIGVDTKLIAD